MTDTLIQNAMILDGTGAPPFKGHVKVLGDHITAVADGATSDGLDLVKQGAQKIVNAEGYCLAPGFIDTHSHFDWMLPLPDHDFLHPLLEQGITTVVTGNCGFSPAPIAPGDGDRINDFGELLIDKPLSFHWQAMTEFIDQLSNQPLLFNNAQLLGHGSVHLAELVDMRRRPSPQELDRIKARTADELGSGVFGLSLGLMYPPGMFYTSADLEILAEKVARRGLVLSVHTRALSKYSSSYPIIPFFGKPHNLRALQEMLTVGLQTGIKLQISHLIFAGRRSWPTAEAAVRMIESARQRGLNVKWDVYPHYCGNSYLNVFLPPWFQKDWARNIEDPKAIRRLKFELKLAARLLGFNLSAIQIMQAIFDGGQIYEGKNLGEIAAQEKSEPLDCFIDLVRKSHGKALQLTYGYSGDDDNETVMESMLAHELCLYATDTILKSSGFANPASYGAFPRILGKFVRDKKTLSLQEAVAKMSGTTARWFGISNRGEVKPGFYADLVLFNPDTIGDNTSKKETAKRPSGIDKVFVNGALAVDGGTYIAGTRKGRGLTSM